jgi:chromosome segregation ATPase
MFSPEGRAEYPIINRLHREVREGLEEIATRGLTLTEHEELDRKCDLWSTYLHDGVTKELQDQVNRAAAEIRTNTGIHDARIDGNRDWIEILRARNTDLAQRLDSLTDPDHGTIRRHRRDIRKLEDRNNTLRDQIDTLWAENELFHDLRDEMRTMRRDLDELRGQAITSVDTSLISHTTCFSAAANYHYLRRLLLDQRHQQLLRLGQTAPSQP